MSIYTDIQEVCKKIENRDYVGAVEQFKSVMGHHSSTPNVYWGFYDGITTTPFERLRRFDFTTATFLKLRNLILCNPITKDYFFRDPVALGYMAIMGFPTNQECNIIADNFYNNKEYEWAIELYKKARDLTVSHKIRLAHAYISVSKYDNARNVNIYHEISDSLITEEDKHILLKIYSIIPDKIQDNNILFVGKLYYDVGNYTKARELFSTKQQLFSNRDNIKYAVLFARSYYYLITSP